MTLARNSKAVLDMEMKAHVRITAVLQEVQDQPRL